MTRDCSPFFQVAGHNWLTDNRRLFPNSAYEILILIFRQTVGFQKERDFIRYSQFCNKTGLGKGAVSNSINFLLKNKFIERFDDDSEPINVMKKGYRGRIYYEISEGLYQKLYQYYTDKWISTRSKTGTYKDKYIQREILTKNNYPILINNDSPPYKDFDFRMLGNDDNLTNE